MDTGHSLDTTSLATYAAPEEYTIAGRTLQQPLVSVSMLKAHLSLLHAVKQLHSAVVDATDMRIPPAVKEFDATHRWTWFVHLAVERSVAFATDHYI